MSLNREQKANVEAFKSWAPVEVHWSQWAKPVLFTGTLYDREAALEIPSIDWLPAFDRHTMIILDLPGERGVLEALALARHGYRPVPIYNGVAPDKHTQMAVDNRGIVTALFWGAKHMQNVSLPEDAPPVFLLDANRMNGTSKQVGTFDNRWCVFPQDMPSALYLKRHAIREVLVRSDHTRDDLMHVLYAYKQKDIRVLRPRAHRAPAVAAVTEPRRYRRIGYRLALIMGLTRNAAGGFGGAIPVPPDRGGYGYG